MTVGGNIYPYPDGSAMSDLKGLLPAVQNVLYKKGKGDNWDQALWLSNPVSFEQTLTFATLAISDKLLADDEMSATVLWPDEVPKGMTEGEVLGIILEIITVTNNTNKAIDPILLRFSAYEAQQTNLDDLVRGRLFGFSGDAVDQQDLVGDIIKYFPLVDSMEIRRNKTKVWTRSRDIGSQLESATASSLTVVISGNIYAVCGIGLTPLFAEELLCRKPGR